MEKGNILSISNYGKVNRYVIKKQKDIHNLFCSLFSNLGFSEDSICKVDIIFDELDNDYIYIDESKKNFEIHLFVTEDFINLIIKTDIEQQKLNKIIGKYFIFPK